MSDPSIHVAYIARREEGVASLVKFLDSYRRHPASHAHRLVMLQKGFAGDHACSWPPWQEKLADIPHTVHPVPDGGFDLGSYRAYLMEASGRTVLFLNSHSEILVDRWLDLMVRHSRPGLLVGATGSWESHRSNALEPFASRGTGLVHRLRQGATAFRASRRPELQNHPPFPNPAIRTNAFLIPPDLHRWLLAWPSPRTKDECYALESGNAGLSRTVMEAGGSLLVAGADGAAHRPLLWPEAGLFRSAGQRNLIINDNQTRRYASATPEEKRSLGWSAWRSFHVLEQP